MGRPVVHVEIIGRDPAGLRGFYGALFGWAFDTSAPVAEAVSDPHDYGFVGAAANDGGAGANAGVGGGAGYEPRVLPYVGVPDVEAALREAERHGGRRVLGPASPAGLVVGRFTDPEGNLVGVAGPA